MRIYHAWIDGQDLGYFLANHKKEARQKVIDFYSVYRLKVATNIIISFIPRKEISCVKSTLKS